MSKASSHLARALPWLWLLFLLGLAACAPDAPPAPEAAASPPAMPRHVLFITVDTLRADHLSLYGYPRETSPRLDEFAQKGVTFERAIAQWPKTGTSFASLFTGQYPQTTGLTHEAAIRVPEEYLTLPEIFAQNGFTNVAVVSNGVLGERLGWNSGFTEYLETWKEAPETSEDPAEYRKWINASIVNRLALPLLERHRDAERLFAWIHYSDPHAPYLLPADEENPFVGDEYYVGDEQVQLENPRATALGDQRDLKYYVAAYDANVRYTDRHVGELLDHAAALGLLENALVIFTSDHGESLGEHGYYFGHGRLPYNHGSHVPLVMVYPPALPEGRRIARPVELVDLYPTLAGWLLAPPPGADDPLPPGLEGESLLPVMRGAVEGEAGALAFAQAGGGSPLTHFRSVQDERFKLIYHPPVEKRQQEIPARWELYRLDEDPGETRDLAQSDPPPPDLRRLHQALTGWMKGDAWIRRPKAEIEEQSQETLKHLRALGYAD